MDSKHNVGSLQIALLLAIYSALSIVFPSSTSAQQPEPPRAQSEIVATDLVNPSDFAISRDGETIFVAEPAAKQIRRIKGDSNEVVVTGIQHNDDEATSISVLTIDDNHILLGVAGFSSPKFALTMFDLSTTENLPLEFNDNVVEPTRNFQRRIKRVDAFDVLMLFEQQAGISIVRKIGEQEPNLCDVQLKDGVLEKLEDRDYLPEAVKVSDLNTLTIDPLGGYFVMVSAASDGFSKLTFSQAEGAVMQSFTLNLPNVVSLGFTPKSQQLFALVTDNDSQISNESFEAGIYEIQSNNEKCSAKLVLPVDDAQKMKMDAAGNAWVLCRKDSNNGSEKSHLLKVTGLNTQQAE